VYVVTGLRPGPYRIKVKKDGFNQVDLTDFTLNVQDTLAEISCCEWAQHRKASRLKERAESIETSGRLSTVIDRQFIETYH